MWHRSIILLVQNVMNVCGLWIPSLNIYVVFIYFILLLIWYSAVFWNQCFYGRLYCLIEKLLNKVCIDNLAGCDVTMMVVVVVAVVVVRKLIRAHSSQHHHSYPLHQEPRIAKIFSS
ncbi:hypothetical protein L1987_78718 [Smallanthus sonchifolius]|uniref:Uncharacterized protein n=1 Tax=Smallanthus sonchifolius TaxID=185202 RepID=A0ACB8ZEH6_9ASTR|nr:hypothetical protein L1987_78718 [Smallanthus sonchifolius]